MKNRGKNLVMLAAGILLGITMAGPVAQAAEEAYLRAFPSTQTFYVDGKQVTLEAYGINGYNYVKLRDIGQVADFNVAYDPVRNCAIIQPNSPYTGEDVVSLAQPSDGLVALPSDGSVYKPEVGDTLQCSDGTIYEIRDVSRWDKNAFAAGPLGDLPTPSCDWSKLDQAQLPEPEVRHFSVQGKEYCFVRNLHETLRMQYTLYNAIGDNPSTWENGGPVLRKSGAQLVQIHLSIPIGMDKQSFWPWYPNRLVDPFNSCPPGVYYLEAWDVYKDGVFQKTEYDFAVSDHK